MAAHSRVVSGRYPPPGASPIADAIRERRGARGITPLDANLLHIPQSAKGYNALLGAVRTEGKLSASLREAIILRIAALNQAAYEWIQHVDLGRKGGLTSGQLYILRDVGTPLPPASKIFGSDLLALTRLTDCNTKGPRVPFAVIDQVKTEFRKIVTAKGTPEAEVEASVEDLYVEAAMIIASYNMVSRFLLSTDVAGSCDIDVPWPVERKEHYIEVPSYLPAKTPIHRIHALTLRVNDSPDTPWIACCNSLITSLEMWSYIIPSMLDQGFNILLHDQRGHGTSELPPAPLANVSDERLTTIPLLASDLSELISSLDIPTPLHAVMGVSQGGATALAFANLYGNLTKSVIVCDTSAKTPQGNKEAWEDRIRVVLGEGSLSPQYATKIGLSSLAEITLPRWFPAGSPSNPSTNDARSVWVAAQICSTDVGGFVAGARALGEYDVLELSPQSSSTPKKLFDTETGHILLVAGKLDGGGKVAEGMRKLGEEWSSVMKAKLDGDNSATTKQLRIHVIPESGHLPMVDQPEKFWDVVGEFLKDIR